MTDTIKILIVDDHHIVRQGLAALLKTVPGFEVLAVRSPADVPDLVLRKLARAHGLHPDEPL